MRREARRNVFMNEVRRSCPEVRLEIEGQVAWISLCRPRARNALTASMRQAVREAFAVAEISARVIVLTGEGPAFCIGHDFEAESSDDADTIWAVMVEDYAVMIEAIEGCQRPTIAALNGPAIGAGVSLALACDIVISRSGSYLSLPFVQMGMVPDCGSYRMLADRAGGQRAIGLALTGQNLLIDEAKSWGLVWDVVPRLELSDRVRQEAQRMAELPEAAVQGLKALARASQKEDRRDWARREAEIQIACLSGG